MNSIRIKNHLKISFVALLTVFATQTVSGQLAKGNWLVYAGLGDISFRHQLHSLEDDTVKVSSLSGSVSIFPKAGYFLTDNFVLGSGIYLDFGSFRSVRRHEDGNLLYDARSTAAYVGLSPFVRQYFGRSENGKSAFYGHLGVGFGIRLLSRQTSKIYAMDGSLLSDYHSTGSGYSIVDGTAALGWNRFLTHNVALDLSLGYSPSFLTQRFSSTFNGNIAIGAGLSILIPGDRE
ncbi:MAG: hypothetical protein IPN95_05140 [Bacteroidetes bacterium]|nr:hypothetical protein [Bacteroidota bacterium]MBP6639268.1 hypothetical protein [Bacteroidia bacterium]